MRKLLSIILAVVMLAGMMTVAIPASAEVVGKYDTFTAQFESGATEIYIEDEADFIAFEQLLFTETSTTTQTTGKTFYLVNDIYLNKGWTAPSDLTKDVVAPVEAEVENYAVFAPAAAFYFKGTFDGQGHVISGVYLTSDAANASALFGYGAVDVVLKNVKVVNSMILSTCTATGEYGIGTFFSTHGGSGSFTIDNVYSSAAIKYQGTTEAKRSIGGIAARSNRYSNETITNTVFAGKIYSEAVCEQYVGGILGYQLQEGAWTFENCGFFGDIKVASDGADSAKKTQVGQLIGRLHCSKGNVTVNVTNCIAGGTGTYSDHHMYSGSLIGGVVYPSRIIYLNITNTIWLNMDGLNPFTQIYAGKAAGYPEEGEGNYANDDYIVLTNSVGVNKISLTGDATSEFTVGKISVTSADKSTRTYTTTGAYDLTSTWTETPVGPLPTALLGSGEGTAFDGAVSYLGYQVKAVEGGYAIRFIGEGAFDEDIANVGLRVGVEGGNLAGLVSKVATTTKVYKGLVVGAEGGEDDYVAADGEFVYTINVGTFTADMGVITVHVTTLVDGGEGAIACQVKTVTIDTAKLPELAG